MSDKKRPLTGSKRRRITLKTPDDGRTLIKRTLAEIFQEGQIVANAGKISLLMSCWLKAWELEKAVDLENRISAIEKQQREEKFRRQAK